MIDQRATETRRRRYNPIAPFYDLMELTSDRRMRSWREKLWAQVPPAEMLEVGVGSSGNSTGPHLHLDTPRRHIAESAQQASQAINASQPRAPYLEPGTL